MIGKVRFTFRHEPAEAVLDGAGRWSCARVPAVVRALNILFDPRREPDGDEPRGHRQVRAVADWLKGTAVLEPGPAPAPAAPWTGDAPRCPNPALMCR